MRSVIAATWVVCALVAAPAAAAENEWLSHRVLNMAHQGGEAEAPSNTMYAYKRALRLGADMLEVDFHSTADGRLVVLHDANVARTTDGSGSVYEMTWAEIRRLDAAHDFVPGEGTETGLPPASYPFRGVRTGERRPPPGFRPADFRIPTLDEVLRAYPDVPINIEIKGRADSDVGSFLRNAELLAALLNGLGRTEGVIVASFNDAAIDRFHALAPEVGLAPATGEVAAFKLANAPLREGRVAFQVPITFQGVTVTDRDFVERAHAGGWAVHVWLSNDPEDEATYNHLLDLGVDGIMPAEPARLEAVLCRRDIPRPPRPDGWPGDHCRHRRASIACDVRATGAALAGRRLKVRLVRRDAFEGRCAGRVRVRSRRLGGAAGAAKRRRVRAAGRFDFGVTPPAEGEKARQVVRLRLSRPERRLARRGVTLRAVARPYGAFPSRSRLRVGT